MERIRNYETIFIIKPDLEEEARDSIIERIKGLIERYDGEINEVDQWGNKKMAYEIKDYRNGYYVRIDFTGGTNIPAELEYDYKILDNILRYLTVNKED